MAIWGVGVDVVDLGRFSSSLQRTPELRSRLFTARELEAGHSTESLAGRFAVKEAFAKALRSPAGMSWQDVEVVTDAAGAPSVELSGAAADRVADLGISAVHVSLAHDTGVATGFVVAEA